MHGQSGTPVTAVPNDGYRFAKWTDGSTDNPRTDTSVTVTFQSQQYLFLLSTASLTSLTAAPDPENPATYTVESETITLRDATKTGYTFVGWYNAASGGDKVTEIAHGSTGDIVLYARWTANQYTVTFDSNGGDSPSFESKLVTYDVAYGELPTVSRTGHTFLGWFTQREGGNRITAESIVKTASDHTLTPNGSTMSIP